MRAVTALMGRFKASDTMVSSMWVTIGMMSSQAIRLASNLVLTRLLIPEYFGLMAIMYSITGFFHMVSDIGLVPSIVNTKRDQDPAFMETAWTIQLIRSCLLAVLLGIAGYPASRIYNEPSLFPMLLVAAVQVLITGFYSMALITEQKHLRQKRIVIVQMVAQVVSTAFMIAVAYYTRSLWSLVAGLVVAAIVTLSLSYRMFESHHSHIRLEKEAAQEIIRFGKWILVASFFGYIATQSRPALMGLFITAAQIGIFTVANTLASVFEMLSTSIANKVLVPRYRQLVVDGKHGLTTVHALRNRFNLVFMPGCVLLAVVGDQLIYLMYDARYADAGWILQLLALGNISATLRIGAGGVLLALGDSKGMMSTQFISAVVTVSALSLGAMWGGFSGIVVAAAVLPTVQYLATLSQLRRHSFHMFGRDAVVTVVTALLILGIWTLTDAPALDHLKNMLTGPNSGS